MKKLLVVVLLGLAGAGAQDSRGKWRCEEGVGCRAAGGADGVGFEACRLLCGSVWPKPLSLNISNKLRTINPFEIHLETNRGGSELDKLLVEAFERVKGRWVEAAKGGSGGGGSGDHLLVYLETTDKDFRGFSLHMDEAYNLTIRPTSDGRMNATIRAEGFAGARHGLETLGQLVVWDGANGGLVTPVEATAADQPAYTYRGLLLDTARNFISVPAILRTLDAMALNKLNTFHWHITDSQSFPFQSATFPNLTEFGAYSKSKVYTVEDVGRVVRYARVRGIRVLPELDAPAHVGEGWEWAPDDATVCFRAAPWTSYCVEPPCGQINPTSEFAYKILEGIYKDMEAAFQAPDLFHMGGDEVNVNCWNTSQPVLNGMQKLGLGRTSEDFHKLWGRFQDRALNSLEKVSGKKRPVILWTSTLTEKDHIEKFLDKEKYIIQVWTKGNDPAIADLLNKGYPVIMSNYDALYFDCGFGAWVGEGNNWCSPYIPWQKVYKNDPASMAAGLGVKPELAKKLLLGSEAALWTEQADDSSIDLKLWPRAAAMAEGLWRGGESLGWEEALPRLADQRQRLVRAGLTPNTIQPEWCTKHPTEC